MQEQLVHFIWHRKLFNHEDLITTEGQVVKIINPGYPDQDQGPDFLQARIFLDDQLWAGHVEIHVRSSSWYLHAHDKDPHYNNVIAHVVWVEDEPVKTSEGIRIPCIELSQRVDPALLMRYQKLMDNEEWIPCAASIPHVQDVIKVSWLERLMAERLENKTEYIRSLLKQCNHDWEQTFFVMLCRQLGAPTNSDPMENLGLKTPLNILRKHADRIDQIEAILFGVAGMLTKELHIDYPIRLKQEFDFLKTKYGLHVIPALQWKFMRMRPAHFPTIRIAQLAVILSKHQQFITLLEEDTTTEEWINRFLVKPANAFWDTHYHFKAEAPFAIKHLGKETAISMMINLVAPFMFFYGKMQGHEYLKEKALRILAELPAEKNAVLSNWQKLGWSPANASQSQAMLHLKKHFCDARKCLHCAVGMQVLKE